MKRSKFISLSILLLCLSLFCVSSVSTIQAEESIYRISLIDKTYSIWKIEEERPPTVVYLNISVTLYNAGPNISDDITVGIWDTADNLPIIIRRNATIPPGQSHVFRFEEDSFFVIGKGQHTINISYYPTNETFLKTSANSGISTLVVQAGSESPTTSTPGFDMLLLMGAVIIIMSIVQYKKRR